jgi:hypothetical protein
MALSVAFSDSEALSVGGYSTIMVWEPFNVSVGFGVSFGVFVPPFL